jgi:hypothetical protein
LFLWYRSVSSVCVRDLRGSAFLRVLALPHHALVMRGLGGLDAEWRCQRPVVEVGEDAFALLGGDLLEGGAAPGLYQGEESAPLVSAGAWSLFAAVAIGTFDNVAVLSHMRRQHPQPDEAERDEIREQQRRHRRGAA